MCTFFHSQVQSNFSGLLRDFFLRNTTHTITSSITSFGVVQSKCIKNLRMQIWNMFGFVVESCVCRISLSFKLLCKLNYFVNMIKIKHGHELLYHAYIYNVHIFLSPLTYPSTIFFKLFYGEKNQIKGNVFRLSLSWG